MWVIACPGLLWGSHNKLSSTLVSIQLVSNFLLCQSCILTLSNTQAHFGFINIMYQAYMTTIEVVVVVDLGRVSNASFCTLVSSPVNHLITSDNSYSLSNSILSRRLTNLFYLNPFTFCYLLKYSWCIMSFKNTWADLAFLHSPTCYPLFPQGCQINVTYPSQILPPQMSTLPHGLCSVWLCTGSGSDEQPGWAAPTLCAHSTAVAIIIRHHIGLSVTAVSVILPDSDILKAGGPPQNSGSQSGLQSRAIWEPPASNTQVTP